MENGKKKMTAKEMDEAVKDFFQGILGEQAVMGSLQECVAMGGKAFTKFNEAVRQIFGDRVNLQEYLEESKKMLEARRKMMDDLSEYLDSINAYSDFLVEAFVSPKEIAEA